MKIPRFWRTPKNKQLLNQRGDTIIEVLIATALVAAILGGAYVTVRANLNGTQSSQERGEALSLAQAQVEELRLDNNLTSASIPGGQAACYSGGKLTTPFNFISSATLDTHLSTSYPNACQVDSAGTSPPTSSNPFYIGITYEQNPYLVYTVHVRWDDLNGGTDEVTLAYRVPVIASTFATAELPATPGGGTPPGGGGGGTPPGGGGGGTPPGGGDNGGGSLYTNNACDLPDADPDCADAPPGDPAFENDPPVLWYGIYLTNSYMNDPSTILGCSWDWGDAPAGSPPDITTDDACQYSEQTQMHCFPVDLPTAPDYAGKTYDVILTMYLTTGTKTYKDITDTVPQLHYDSDPAQATAANCESLDPNPADGPL